MGFSPKYEEYGNKPKPEHNWTTPAGTWVGIWGGDWGDLLLRALAKYHPEYECEVWRPDLRADKVYSVQFEPGFVHRCYPAVMRRYFRRCRFVRKIFSPGILDQVGEHDRKDTVFLVSIKSHMTYINKIIKTLKNAKLIHYNFINSEYMLPNYGKNTNLFKTAGQFISNRSKIRGVKSIRNLLTMNDNPDALSRLKELSPSINIFNFMWGYDLDFWRPIISKTEARESLGISKDKYVILLSQRLVPEYQIDEIIIALSEISASKEFLCIITGHGLNDYEFYLNDLVARHKMQDKIFFVGYVSDELLRKYFIAADLFVNLPINSAGSAGALKATMTGTPVLIIPKGALYMFLQSQDAGEFVDPNDHLIWAEKLLHIIEGRTKIKVPSRNALTEYFSWENNVKDLTYAIENAK